MALSPILWVRGGESIARLRHIRTHQTRVLDTFRRRGLARPRVRFGAGGDDDAPISGPATGFPGGASWGGPQGSAWPRLPTGDGDRRRPQGRAIHRRPLEVRPVRGAYHAAESACPGCTVRSGGAADGPGNAGVSPAVGRQGHESMRAGRPRSQDTRVPRMDDDPGDLAMSRSREGFPDCSVAPGPREAGRVRRGFGMIRASRGRPERAAEEARRAGGVGRSATRPE